VIRNRHTMIESLN